MPGNQQDPFDIEVGRRVRALRLEEGMSPEEIGKLLDLTLRRIQEHENGADPTAVARLQRVARMLGLPALVFDDAGAVNATDGNLLEMIDAGSALRLLRAYARIRSPSLQRALTNLAEEMAEA